MSGMVKIEVRDGVRKLIPIADGALKVFSMSLIAPDSAIGLVGTSSGELVSDVIDFGEWGEVDYYCIDLPAGSGDEMRASFKCLAKSLVGCVVVAQPAHLVSAERILKLLMLNEIPVLGIIENMAWFEEKDGEKNYIFGEPHAEQLAEKYGVEFMGHIPIVPVNVNGGKRIPEPYADPIKKVVTKAEQSEVTMPGFLERALNKAKEVTTAVVGPMLVDLYFYANKEIPIQEIQKEFNYPGGRLIRLVLVSDSGKGISAEHYRIKDGKLSWEKIDSKDKYVAIDKELKESGVEIFAKVKALAEAFVGERELRDGRKVPFDLKQAWLNNEIVPIGKKGDMIQALEFIMGVYAYVKEKRPSFMIEFAKRLL